MPRARQRASVQARRASRGQASDTAPRSPLRDAPKKLAAGRGLRAPFKHPVRILFLDVDGTLTDGIIGFTSVGDSRHFWVRDGLALEWARDLGVLPVAISGRDSEAVAARMRDLKLEHYLGIKDKVAVAERVLKREGARWDECVMVGDDLPDVPMLKRVGWPIAVADAAPEVLRFAKSVTRARAGFGAVREAAEAVLKHNGQWQRVLEKYEAASGAGR